MSKYDAVKKNLQEYYEKNANLGRKEIFRVFLGHGIPKSTLNRWLACLEKNTSLNRKVGSGRPIKIATKSNIAKIKKKFNHRSGCSQRKVAREFKTTQSYISKILKYHTNIRCRKKTKKPCMTEKQKKAARPKCRRLAEKYAKSEFVLDDESYFTKSNSSLSGNDQFYSDNLNLTPDNVKNKYQAKFEEKVLVYLAISTRGCSKALFF